jgi:hypothetical protein
MKPRSTALLVAATTFATLALTASPAQAATHHTLLAKPGAGTSCIRRPRPRGRACPSQNLREDAEFSAIP